MFLILAGGVGAARFLEGLVRLVPQQEITVVSNTGDDLELYGLHVSPDIDIVIYTLAGAVDPARGWGLAGDTFHCLRALARFGHQTWFSLGDRDLATHIHRTLLLRQGHTLSQATQAIANAFGLRLRLLPMSDDPVRTKVATDAGPLDFQDYFVRRQAQDTVHSIQFAGAESAAPAPGLLEAIAQAQDVIVAPSNPLVSIGPILAVPGLRQALRDTQASVVAISPIVGGATIKGPADRMLKDRGMEARARQVASLYQDFLDCLIIDTVDANLQQGIESLGVRAIVADTIMKGPPEKEALARVALNVLQRP